MLACIWLAALLIETGSLRRRRDADGKVLFRCHAGCKKAVVSALCLAGKRKDLSKVTPISVEDLSNRL